MSNSPALARLLGDEVIKQDGDRLKVADLPGRVLGLYFSAGWCNSCRMFNQQLSTFCEEFDKNPDRKGSLHVVFVSSDRTQAQFNESFQQLPKCYALPYHERTKKVSYVPININLSRICMIRSHFHCELTLSLERLAQHVNVTSILGISTVEQFMN